MPANRLEKELAFDQILEELFPDDLLNVGSKASEFSEPMDRDQFNRSVADVLKGLERSSDLKKGDLKPKMDNLYNSYLTIFKKTEEIVKLMSYTKKEVDGFFAKLEESLKSFLVNLKIIWKESAKQRANKSAQQLIHKVIDVYTDEKLSTIAKRRISHLRHRFDRFKDKILEALADRDLERVMGRVKPEKLNTEKMPEFRCLASMGVLAPSDGHLTHVRKLTVGRKPTSYSREK